MARMTGTGGKRGFWPRWQVIIVRDGNPDGGNYGGEDTAQLVAQSLATATGCHTRVLMKAGPASTPVLVATREPAPLPD